MTEILRPVPRLRRARVLSAAIPGLLAACIALLASPPAQSARRADPPAQAETTAVQAETAAAPADAEAMLREFAGRLRAPDGFGAIDRASARLGIPGPRS